MSGKSFEPTPIAMQSMSWSAHNYKHTSSMRRWCEREGFTKDGEEEREESDDAVCVR